MTPRVALAVPDSSSRQGRDWASYVCQIFKNHVSREQEVNCLKAKGGITMAVKRRDVKRSGLDAKIFECFYDGGEMT